MSRTRLRGLRDQSIFFFVTVNCLIDDEGITITIDIRVQRRSQRRQISVKCFEYYSNVFRKKKIRLGQYGVFKFKSLNCYFVATQLQIIGFEKVLINTYVFDILNLFKIIFIRDVRIEIDAVPSNTYRSDVTFYPKFEYCSTTVVDAFIHSILRTFQLVF